MMNNIPSISNTENIALAIQQKPSEGSEKSENIFEIDSYGSQSNEPTLEKKYVANSSDENQDSNLSDYSDDKSNPKSVPKTEKNFVKSKDTTKSTNSTSPEKSTFNFHNHSKSTNKNQPNNFAFLSTHSIIYSSIQHSITEKNSSSAEKSASNSKNFHDTDSTHQIDSIQPTTPTNPPPEKIGATENSSSTKKESTTKKNTHLALDFSNLTGHSEENIGPINNDCVLSASTKTNSTENQKTKKSTEGTNPASSTFKTQKNELQNIGQVLLNKKILNDTKTKLDLKKTEANKLNVFSLKSAENLNQNFKIDPSLPTEQNKSFINLSSENLTSSMLSATISALHKSNQSGILLRLDPPNLGHLDIQIQIASQGIINVVFVPSSADAAHALQSSLPQLDIALAQSGLTLGQTEIGGQFSQSGQQGQQHSQNTQTPKNFSNLNEDANISPVRHKGLSFYA